MNKFEYVLKHKELAATKTLKAKEAIIRDCDAKLQSIHHKDGKVEEESKLNLYKIMSYAMNLHTSRDNLPDFLHSRLVSAEKHVFTKLITNGSYKDIVDTFQYNTEREVIMHTCDVQGLRELAEIVKDNKLLFTIDYSIANSNAVSNILDDLQHSSDHQTNSKLGANSWSFTPALILEIEDIKQKMPKETFSIIEDVLDRLYAESFQTEIDSTSLQLAPAMLRSLATAADVMVARSSSMVTTPS